MFVDSNGFSIWREKVRISLSTRFVISSNNYFFEKFTNPVLHFVDCRTIMVRQNEEVQRRAFPKENKVSGYRQWAFEQKETTGSPPNFPFGVTFLENCRYNEETKVFMAELPNILPRPYMRGSTRVAQYKHFRKHGVALNAESLFEQTEKLKNEDVSEYSTHDSYIEEQIHSYHLRMNNEKKQSRLHGQPQGKVSLDLKQVEKKISQPLPMVGEKVPYIFSKGDPRLKPNQTTEEKVSTPEPEVQVEEILSIGELVKRLNAWKDIHGEDLEFTIQDSGKLRASAVYK